MILLTDGEWIRWDSGERVGPVHAFHADTDAAVSTLWEPSLMTEPPTALNLTRGDLAVSEAAGVDGLVFTFEFLSERGAERLSGPVPAEQVASLAPFLTGWLTARSERFG